MRLGLYTILPLRILYGAWHTKGGSGVRRILRNRRTTVLQQCGQCRRAGGMKGRLIRAETTRSETISCKGQDATLRGEWILIIIINIIGRTRIRFAHVHERLSIKSFVVLSRKF